VYAIVRSGGRQHKEVGATVRLPAVMVVDGENITADAAALGNVAVTAEVVAQTKGPKIDILKFRNKTGYRRRQGHRQQLTKLKVTSIETRP
jgi:large subunit ribosomal protein L21